MLFGELVSQQTSLQHLQAAWSNGINFFDSAEMYPVPQSAATAGRSEQYLGAWLKTQRREDVVIATKVAGPSGQMSWIRGGPVKMDKAGILAAIEGSLQRLQTDYVDLYQLHWPDRYVPMFGDVDYNPAFAYSSVPIEEQLEALSQAVKEGKVRYYGLSNETAWGLMKFQHTAEKMGVPKMVSLQNAYSLTCRTFDAHLAECCHLENVGLLAYSPLAMGLLTGKYLRDGGPPSARLNRYKNRYAEAESRYGPKPNVHEAVRAYCALAATAGMTPTELAIRFVLSHQLVSSIVIGATTTRQLQELVEAAMNGPLEQELLDQIDSVHAQYPSPTP